MRNLSIFGIVFFLLAGAGLLVSQGGRPAGTLPSPSTINVMDYGASPAAAAAANTTAIHNAIDAMAAGDTLLIPAFTFPITNVVFDAPDHCRLDCRGVLAPTPGAGVGVEIGDTTGAGEKMFYVVKGLKVIPSGTSYPWTKDFVGVRLINLMYCDVDVFYVENCWTGLQVTGTDSLVTMHNTVWVNKIIDCYECINVENNVGGAAGGGGQVLNNKFLHGKLLGGTLADKIAFSVQMTGAGTCTMTIAGNVLTTDASDGGVTDFNLDLTLAANDTIGEVIAIIEADGDYTCTINANAETSWRSVQLTPVAGVDIQSAAYATMIDGMEGNTGLIITHDGANAVTSNTFESFYVSTGLLTQACTLAGTSNFLRNFIPDVANIEGMSVTANGISTVLEMSAAAVAMLTDGGTGTNTPHIGEVLRASAWALPGTINATSDHTVFTAPVAGTVTRVDVISTTGIATSDVNYWNVNVANTTAANELLAADKTTMATGGAAVTANVAWSMTPDQNATIAAGDVIQVQLVKTLAADDWTTTTVIVHFRPTN